MQSYTHIEPLEKYVKDWMCELLIEEHNPTGRLTLMIFSANEVRKFLWGIIEGNTADIAHSLERSDVDNIMALSSAITDAAQALVDMNRSGVLHLFLRSEP